VAGTTYQLAGTQGPSGVGGATGNPKDRAQLSINWSRGPLDITTNFNYTSSFSTLDPSVGATDCASTGVDAGGRNYFAGLVQPAQYCSVASFTVTNLNVQYKLSPNLTLKGSILNLFDKRHRSTSRPTAMPMRKRRTTPRCTKPAQWAASSAWAWPTRSKPVVIG
jgi:iron complex outermembrane receptor protein